MDRGLVGFDRADSIKFQLLGEQWQLFYTDFSLLSGLYDTNFISTPQYEQLLIDFPAGTQGSLAASEKGT